MTKKFLTPLPPEGVLPSEWLSLLATRDPNGNIAAEDVDKVLINVVLTEEMLATVSKTLKDAGFTIVGDSESDAAAEVPGSTVIDKKKSSTKSGGSIKGDAIGLYLQEIGQVQLLTVDDERRLGKAIQAGLSAKLTELPEAASLRDKRDRRTIISEGERATEELVKANLRLVVSVARRYNGRELQLADLIQEGNIGLMRAAEKYDWERGFKFSTYSTWWIRQAMMRAMSEQGRTIRIPGHVVERMNRLKRAQRELVVELNREPTVEELSERAFLEPDQISELMQLSTVTMSLDAPLSQDEDSSAGYERVYDDEQETPLDIAERNLLVDVIRSELSNLPERERRILEKRFGIHDGKPMTLDDVALEEDVTRERIRQIEQKTLARLRHPNNSLKLRGLIDEE